MNRRLGGLVLLLVLLVVVLVVLARHRAGAGDRPPVTPSSITPTVAEDDPGWDCRIHGDRLCGADRRA